MNTKKRIFRKHIHKTLKKHHMQKPITNQTELNHKKQTTDIRRDFFMSLVKK